MTKLISDLVNNEYGVTNLRLLFPGYKQKFFDQLDFKYQVGEKVLILGTNGSGKSTLLQVLAGLIPTQVEIPAKWDWIQVPKNLAFCLQDPECQLTMPYSDEEIAFVLENRAISKQQMPKLIEQFYQQMGLTMDNFHSPINQLSGGNKQKLQLATLLALESDVLFLDEPTAMLDAQATQTFWQAIKDKFSQQTVLIVEHKITDVLDFATRLIVLDQKGIIRADGEPEQVFARQKDFLDQVGIWHPTSWIDLAQSSAIKPIGTVENSKTEISSEQEQQEPLLQLDNFQVLRNKRQIVSAKQLKINRGEWVCLIGSNGAGKSTLLHGIIGLEASLGECKLAVDTSQCGFVFQNPEYQFVTDLVIDELAYSLEFTELSDDEKQARVDEFLTIFSLEKLQQQHPFSLSMGEKRRLSVATSLITYPALLLLDEPTLGLDAKNSFNLLALLQQFQRQGTSIIMITHEREIVLNYANQVWQVTKQQVSQLTEQQIAQHSLLQQSIDSKIKAVS